MRLDKFLAEADCGSRSEVKQLIKKGLVRVNGVTASRPEQKTDPRSDHITLRGIPLRPEQNVWYLLHKPSGYLTATTDRRAPTVMDLLSEKDRKRPGLFPVGRLDLDTEGLLLITDDGAAAHRLLSPVRHVPKTYHALVCGQLGEEAREAFARGIRIGEAELTRPAKLTVLETRPEVSFVEITITEGRYHQVKRMVRSVGSRVLYLRRVSMGPISLDLSLAPGDYRRLTAEEVRQLTS